MNIWYRGPDATGTAATTLGGSRGQTRPVLRHHSHRKRPAWPCHRCGRRQGDVRLLL